MMFTLGTGLMESERDIAFTQARECDWTIRMQHKFLKMYLRSRAVTSGSTQNHETRYTGMA